MRRLSGALVLALLAMQPGLAAKEMANPPPPQPRVSKQQPQRPVPPQRAPQRAPASCAQPLRQGCEGMQASCRMACPPMWSTNPAAPAFTPTNRAACTQQCLTRYLSCLRLYGC